jgi:hypothetical protein
MTVAVETNWSGPGLIANALAAGQWPLGLLARIAQQFPDP